MTDLTPAIILSKTIDPEHDTHLTVVAVPNYNGFPVATIIGAGYPIMYVEVTEDRYVFQPLSAYSAEDFSAHEQAAATTWFLLGIIPENQYLRYVESAGDVPDYDGLMEYADPQLQMDFQREISEAIHRWYGDLTPDVQGDDPDVQEDPPPDPA